MKLITTTRVLSLLRLGPQDFPYYYSLCTKDDYLRKKFFNVPEHFSLDTLEFQIIRNLHFSVLFPITNYESQIVRFGTENVRVPQGIDSVTLTQLMMGLTFNGIRR